MIISWFTQPQNKNASYYQYDTVTQQFSRTRLELGRQSTSGTNDTFVSYKAQRSVGFSTRKLTTSDRSHWSVNDDGKLCYDSVALSSAPTTGDKVYDSSAPKEFVHRGNPVTDSPSLPAGIEPKHLALLANDAMVNRRQIDLTAGTATQEDLIAAIKGKVCKVLDVKSFADVTDAKILDKLTDQIGKIRAKAGSARRSALDEALTKAKDANDLIKEQIEEGELTPTADFETAFSSLQQAIGKAATASSGADVAQALSEIAQAQKSIDAAIANIDAAQHEAVANQLETAKNALAEAQTNATEWQGIEEEYEPLAEAETIDDYEREIGIESSEAVV